MTKEQKQLWLKIKSFELDDSAASLSFSDRLARENGWTMEYSLHAIEEYKKFIFLLLIAQHPLTPSDQVDQVWHLHLLYTESYWVDFCEHTLGRKIHHGPTKGGEKEQSKYTDWYEKTKEVYRSTFNYDAPNDFWPSSEDRFSDLHFQRVNINQNWIIKKFFK